MAPITDDTVEVLQDTIRKLESRVHQLEAKIGGGDTSRSKITRSSIRMIIMGPPGAGMELLKYYAHAFKTTNLHPRQGNTSTKDT